MIIGVPRETFPGEQRVALIPAHIPAIAKLGGSVLVESGAGVNAGFPDDQYREKSAQITADRKELFSKSDVILQVRGLGANPEFGMADLELMHSCQVLIGFLRPYTQAHMVEVLASKNVIAFALELVPRISRAQNIDALSSAATIAGYKAVVMAADRLPRMFPMLMTAAGTVTPAKVFVIGAGVAGLQSIASARRLGAVVEAYDIRPAVKEQVESLGAKFVELPLEAKDAEGKSGYAKAMDEEFYRKQRELMARVIAESDVVITTAFVPGKKAPVLVTEEMVLGMKPGSVIVDLAAEQGGNCSLTKPDTVVEHNGVTILGPSNIASMVPYHASQLLSKNLANFLTHLIKGGEFKLNMKDEIIRDSLVAKDGEITHVCVCEFLHCEEETKDQKGAE